MINKLSIIIPFCDKDYQYIDALSKEINERIKIKHEVIFVDNRESKKDKKISPVNSKVISKGYNLSTLGGRMFGTSVATGDYIWFVDSDDDVYSVNECFKNFDEDIINFNFYDSGKRKEEDCNKHVEKVEEIINYSALWNKWIKKCICEKCFSKFPKDATLSQGEDFLMTVLIIRYAKTVKVLNKTFYCFNSERGLSNTKNIKNFENFKIFLNGFGNLETIKEKVLIKHEEEKYKSIYEGDELIIYILTRLFACQEDILIKSTKEILKTISLDDIKRILSKKIEYFLKKSDHRRMLIVLSYLKDQYPKKMEIIYNIYKENIDK